MRMKKLSMLLVAGVCALLSSCSNEDIVESPVKVGDKEVAEVNTLDFIYKGKLYSSEFQYADADSSDIIVLDKEAARVWKSLGDNANLAGFMHDDGVIEYFDNELERSQNMKNMALTRAWGATEPALSEATVTCYENTDFKKGEIKYTIKGREKYEVSDLSATTALNDKISSIRLNSSYVMVDLTPNIINSAMAVFYQHPNYEGVSLSMKVSYDSQYTEHHKLKKVSTPVGGNWNDKISSLRLYGSHGGF